MIDGREIGQVHTGSKYGSSGSAKTERCGKLCGGYRISFIFLVVPIAGGESWTFFRSTLAENASLLDIGFEDLAKSIYYSKDAVEIPERYSKALELVVKNSRLIAAVKREIINQLNVK